MLLLLCLAPLAFMRFMGIVRCGASWVGRPPDGRPLYVGKAEDSLIARDLRTHFGSGHTGSSTLRRSFAALLAQHLDLHAHPLNTRKPERPANYGLSAAEDERLTLWMQSNLRPLNLAGVRTPWRGLVKSARSAMADQAQAWVGSSSDLG
jgi:hypothetical protein